MAADAIKLNILFLRLPKVQMSLRFGHSNAQDLEGSREAENMLLLFLTTVVIMIFDFFLMQKVQRRDSLALRVSRGRMQDMILLAGIHKWHSLGANGSDGNFLILESHESGVTRSQPLAGQILNSPLPELRGHSLHGPLLYCFSGSHS